MKSTALLAIALLCCASVASARLFSSPEEWKAEARRNLQGFGGGHDHGHEHKGRYGVYGQGMPHHYGVYGQEHKHHGYGAYGHRRLASIEAGATRELQGLTHGHKHHGRYGVYGQGMPHHYGVYGQEHKHRGYGAYGHRRLASIEAGATRELQGFASHGHKHHGRYGVYGQEHKHRGYGVYGQEHKHHGYGAYGHRRLASIEAGATRELQGFFSQGPHHGHKQHGRYGVYGQEHKHHGYGVYGQGHKGHYGAYGRW